MFAGHGERSLGASLECVELCGFVAAGSALPTAFGDAAVVDKFVSATAHPLAYDIFRGLAGGLPRIAAGQLWKIVPDPLKKPALLEAISLEAAYIDSATISALESVHFVAGTPPARQFQLVNPSPAAPGAGGAAR